MEQHAGFDQLPIRTLAKGESLDQRRAHRQIKQAFAISSCLLPIGHIDETQLFRPVREKRRVEPIGRDAMARLLKRGIAEKTEV